MNPVDTTRPAATTGHRPPLRSATMLAIAAAAVFPVSAVAPLGIAPLGAALAIAIAVLVALGWAPKPNLAVAPIVIVGALVAWAAVSVIWSSAPHRAPTTSLRLVVIAVAGCLTVAAAAGLPTLARDVVRRSLLIGLAATVAVLLVIALWVHIAVIRTGAAPITSIFTGPSTAAADLITFNRAASVIALLFWPVLIVAWRQGKTMTVALAAATACLLLALNSGAPVIALIAGAATFTVAYYWPRLATVVAIVGIMVFTAATPAINSFIPAIGRATEATQIVDGSINHRLQIWGFVAERAAQRPLTGWGLDASRTLGDANTVQVTTSSDGGQSSAELLPLHPHNALLQVWVELGLPGATLTALLLVWLVLFVRRAIPDRVGAAAALATLAAGLVIAELSYGIWQGWWQAALWLTAALTAAVVLPGPAKD